MQEGTDLNLDLVYNPGGGELPPAQVRFRLTLSCSMLTCSASTLALFVRFCSGWLAIAPFNLQHIRGVGFKVLELIGL